MPKFNEFKDKDGKHIRENEYSQRAAENLANVQWKKNDNLPPDKPADETRSTQEDDINDEEFHIAELNCVIDAFQKKQDPWAL